MCTKILECGLYVFLGHDSKMWLGFLVDCIEHWNCIFDNHFFGYYSLCSYSFNGSTNTIYSTFAMASYWIIPEYFVCYQLRQGDANKCKDVFILKLTGWSISPDLMIMNIVSKVFFDVLENIRSVPPLSCHDCCYLTKGPLIYFGPWTRLW